MSDEKTIEQLEIEYASLKKRNLEKQIALEKAKIEDEEKAKLKEDMRKEIMTELKQQNVSTITSEQPSKLAAAKSNFEKFAENYRRRLGVKNPEKKMRYEDRVMEECGGGY